MKSSSGKSYNSSSDSEELHFFILFQLSPKRNGNTKMQGVEMRSKGFATLIQIISEPLRLERVSPDRKNPFYNH